MDPLPLGGATSPPTVAYWRKLLLVPMSTQRGGQDQEQHQRSGHGCRRPGTDVGRALSDGVDYQAAHREGQSLSGTVAQEPHSEHTTQERIRNLFLQNGVGGHVVYAVGQPRYRQRDEGEDERG